MHVSRTTAAALAAALASVAWPAIASAAPDTSDKCTYNGNGIATSIGTRSCVSVGTGGQPESYGQPNTQDYAAIGNGHDAYPPQGNAQTSRSDNGYSNAASAQSNSGNSVSASSSLVDGTLHGYVATGNVAYASAGGINTRIGDTITFNNTSGGALVLDLGYAFDGIFTAGAYGFESYTDGSVILGLKQPGGLYGPIRFASSGGYVDSVSYSQFDAVTSSLSQHYDSYGNASDYTYTGSFDATTGKVQGSFLTSLLIPVGSSDLAFALTLSLDCRARGSVCDFGHTGRLNIGALPQGLSYTSGSGVLLSANTAAVPEPATWAMTIAGLGLVGAALRRRGRGRTMVGAPLAA